MSDANSFSTKWMVDIIGRSESTGPKSLVDALTSQNFKDFIDRQGGLAAAVQAEIDNGGWSATDRGGGGDQWHVGVPFGDLDSAVDYSRHMTEKFRTAIALGSLRLMIKTWSIRYWV